MNPMELFRAYNEAADLHDDAGRHAAAIACRTVAMEWLKAIGGQK